jgi:hypothetical protein
MLGWPQLGCRHEQPVRPPAGSRQSLPAGRCGGGGGRAGAAPECPERHSQGRRRAPAGWRSSPGVLRRRGSLALQEGWRRCFGRSRRPRPGWGRPGLSVRIGRCSHVATVVESAERGPAGRARRWAPIACGPGVGRWWRAAPGRPARTGPPGTDRPPAARRVTSPAPPMRPSSMASTGRGMAAAIAWRAGPPARRPRPHPRQPPRFG